MYCYHINVGHPVLAQGSRYLAPIAETVWAAHAGDDYRRQGAGYRTLPAPQMNFHEQVWQHEMVADAAGEVPVALVNDAVGLGFEVVTRKGRSPCQYPWPTLHSGQHALGLEPSPNNVRGTHFARQPGALTRLDSTYPTRYNT